MFNAQRNTIVQCRAEVLELEDQLKELELVLRLDADRERYKMRINQTEALLSKSKKLITDINDLLTSPSKEDLIRTEQWIVLVRSNIDQINSILNTMEPIVVDIEDKSKKLLKRPRIKLSDGKFYTAEEIEYMLAKARESAPNNNSEQCSGPKRRLIV